MRVEAIMWKTSVNDFELHRVTASWNVFEFHKQSCEIQNNRIL